MSKHWQAFIILALTTFLFVIIYPFGFSHLNALPNQTEKSHCKLEKAVCLDNQFILLIDNIEKVGGFSQAERAIEIRKRIKKIADNPSIKMNDLKIEDWEGAKITAITSPNTVIFTLTDDDVQATNTAVIDKNKLANQYLQRIRNAINIYREKSKLSRRFAWIKRLKKVFFQARDYY